MGSVVKDGSGEYYVNAKGGQSKIRDGLVKDVKGNFFRVKGEGRDAYLVPTDMDGNENKDNGYDAPYKGESKMDPKLRKDIHTKLNHSKELDRYENGMQLDSQDSAHHDVLDDEYYTDKIRRAEGEFKDSRHRREDMGDSMSDMLTGGIGKIMKLLGGEASPHKLKKRSMSLMVMGDGKGDKMI